MCVCVGIVGVSVCACGVVGVSVCVWGGCGCECVCVGVVGVSVCVWGRGVYNTLAPSIGGEPQQLVAIQLISKTEEMCEVTNHWVLM